MWLRFVCKNAGGAGWCAAAHLASLSAANSAAEKAEFSASSQYTRTLLARRGRVASPGGESTSAVGRTMANATKAIGRNYDRAELAGTPRFRNVRTQTREPYIQRFRL